jgi:tetratricopeptide (TPR) repeat protein
VYLLRQQPPDREGELREDLALCLSNLGPRLAAVGRDREALAASREAVELYRQLTRAAPRAFAADVARSLHNLGNRLEDQELHEEALAAGAEALRWALEPSDERPTVLHAHAEAMLEVYLARCDDLATSPDETLLRRARALLDGTGRSG